MAQGEEREIHSWPGANGFDLTEIDQIVDNGPFGTGSFGGYLLDIFDNDATRFDYRGQAMREGRQVLIYAYSVARSASHYEIRTQSSWTATAYSGRFEIDPQSLEIEHVAIETPRLPAETGLCQATSTLDYERVEIGDGSFLLPSKSQMHLILRNQKETDTTTTFTACREYQAHSTLAFTPPPLATASTAASPKRVPSAPPRRYFLDLRLNTAIDTEVSAAGDPISATVVADVHPYQSKSVVIPAGAVAHGRINRIEHHYLPYVYVVIGISFQSLEIEDETLPFTARPVISNSAVTYSPGSGSTASEQVVHTDAPVASTPMPQVRIPIGPPNSFVFPYEKHHVIAAGTVSPWVTLYRPQ